MEKKRVIVYVDGYNFYYGLKNGQEMEMYDYPKAYAEKMMLKD
jgi:hypothetical protein